jgi:hypothetical protein
MRVRDTWLLEEHYFDEPNDWSVAPELKPLLRGEPSDEEGFRGLLEDGPASSWNWGDS